jgi:lipopolysaccharide transport system ATP-binding protein
MDRRGMSKRIFRIGIFGTFDVQNFGDLLFPLIAEAELTQRLGPIELLRFSYHAKSAPPWPYKVTSVADLPVLAAGLDGVLIGGGFIVRFDKEVAPGYGPPASGIHHPTGYWLTPALMALQHGVPLIWNAPGMHCNGMPVWALPLLKLALEHSAYIRVRDEPSRRALATVAPDAAIEVLPDTGFGIGRLIDAQPSAAFTSLQQRAGLHGPYVVVQATYGIDSFLDVVRTHPALFEGYRFVILPIGPVLHDRESNIGDLPGAVYLPQWPQPLLLAELLGRAQAVVGHSYHLAITALACGVPVFCSADLSVGKYTALAGFDTIYPLARGSRLDPQWVMSRLGKKEPSSLARQALDPLARHWDQVADLVTSGRRPTEVPLNRFWQELPNLLEVAADAAEASRRRAYDLATAQAQALDAAQTQQRRIDSLEAALATVRAQAARERLDSQHRIQQLEGQLRDVLARAGQLDAALAEAKARAQQSDALRLATESQLAALHASHSMKITAPLRLAGRAWRRVAGTPRS